MLYLYGSKINIRDKQPKHNNSISIPNFNYGALDSIQIEECLQYLESETSSQTNCCETPIPTPDITPPPAVTATPQLTPSLSYFMLSEFSYLIP